MKPRYQPQVHTAERKMKLQPEDVIPEWAIERSIAKRLLVDLMTLRLHRNPTPHELANEYSRRRRIAQSIIWPEGKAA